MLQVRQLSKVYYPSKGAPVTALDSIDLDIADKGLVFLLGKSGSGKSTLLNILGGLDSYSQGQIIIKGKSSAGFSASDFDSYRNTFIGFIFQEFNILEDYSVGKNIGLALELQHKKADRAAIDDILAQVDLAGYYERMPNELSGGQKQRVAIARALVKNPDIIMADEPTGSLDSNTGKSVFDTLKKLAQHKLVIVVSHDRENAEVYGDRIIELADGKIIADRTRTQAGTLTITAPISFVDDSLVAIQPRYQLDHNDVARINKMLARATSTSYISMDASANVQFDGRTEHKAAAARYVSTSAHNLSIKKYAPSDFSLVRSSLPFRHSLAMGASGLKLKPIRLGFTILLALVAFVMFGFTITAATVNRNSVEINALSQHNVRNLMVTSVGQLPGGYHNQVWGKDITDAQRARLQQLTGNAPMTVVTAPSQNNWRESLLDIKCICQTSSLIVECRCTLPRFCTGVDGGVHRVSMAL
jgi:ABC-type lipoprotein export system ATPase subunit